MCSPTPSRTCSPSGPPHQCNRPRGLRDRRRPAAEPEAGPPVGDVAVVLAELAVELLLATAALRGERGRIAELRIVGPAQVGLELLPGPGDLVFVEDPNGPAGGVPVQPGFHPQAEQVVLEDLGVEIRGEVADLSQEGSSFEPREEDRGRSPERRSPSFVVGSGYYARTAPGMTPSSPRAPEEPIGEGAEGVLRSRLPIGTSSRRMTGHVQYAALSPGDL